MRIQKKIYGRVVIIDEKIVKKLCQIAKERNESVTLFDTIWSYYDTEQDKDYFLREYFQVEYHNYGRKEFFRCVYNIEEFVGGERGLIKGMEERVENLEKLFRFMVEEGNWKTI